MKFSIGRDELLNALQAVIGVVEKKQTMPILSNLLLKQSGGQLTIVGTDLELELVTTVSTLSGEDGSTTVPARKFFDICKGLPDGCDIEATLSAQRMTVKSSRSRFVLSTLSAEEFPFLEDIQDAQQIPVDMGTLRQLLGRTHFAMAHQDVRYYLNGLLLEAKADLLRAVATDGHRLALSDAPGEYPVKEPISVIVPRKAVMELMRLIDDDEENVSLAFSSNHLQLSLGTTRFTTKLIDGRFPDYERVIPEKGDKMLTADRENVRRALQRAAILSNEKFRGVRLLLEQGGLKLQAQNPEHEEAEEELEVQYEGEALEIGFNVNYLLDALGALESEEFLLELTSQDKSGLITEKDDTRHRYVVMPMRL